MATINAEKLVSLLVLLMRQQDARYEALNNHVIKLNETMAVLAQGTSLRPGANMRITQLLNEARESMKTGAAAEATEITRELMDMLEANDDPESEPVPMEEVVAMQRLRDAGIDPFKAVTTKNNG